MQLNMLEQQGREIQQQVGLVNQKIGELTVLKLSLNRIHETKEKEFLAPLGEGVFLKAKIEEKELFVNVGSKLVVRKSIKETEDLIERQVKQLESVKNELEEQVEKLNTELQKLVKIIKAEQEQEHAPLEESLGEHHHDHDSLSVKNSQKKKR